jgi:hypothetical protein
MPHYMLQVGYTAEAWGTLIKNPANRVEQLPGGGRGTRG